MCETCSPLHLLLIAVSHRYWYLGCTSGVCTFTDLLVVIGALQDGYQLVPTSLYKSGYSLRQLPFHNLRLDAELH
jgi:hypothetical protein